MFSAVFSAELDTRKSLLIVIVLGVEIPESFSFGKKFHSFQSELVHHSSGRIRILSRKETDRKNSSRTDRRVLAAVRSIVTPL